MLINQLTFMCSIGQASKRYDFVIPDEGLHLHTMLEHNKLHKHGR